MRGNSGRAPVPRQVAPPVGLRLVEPEAPPVPEEPPVAKRPPVAVAPPVEARPPVVPPIPEEPPAGPGFVESSPELQPRAQTTVATPRAITELERRPMCMPPEKRPR